MSNSTLASFCGSMSLDPWTGDGLGLCFAELFIHIPLTILYISVSLVYCIIFRRSAAFEMCVSNIFWLRFIFSLLIVIFCIAALCFAYILPSMSFLSSADQPFILTHIALRIVTWLVIQLYDFMLGKSCSYSSRGPFFHLFLSFVFIYINVADTWYIYRQVHGSWRLFLLSTEVTHIVLYSMYFLTKVPVIYSMEEPRVRSARLSRSTHGTKTCSVVTNGDTISLSHPAASPNKSEDSASFPSRLLFCWMNSTISKGYYGELSSIENLPELPHRLDTYVLESDLPSTIQNIQKGQQYTVYNDSDEHNITSAKLFGNVLFRRFGKEFMLLGFIKFLLSSANLCSPLAMSRFITSLSQNSHSRWVSMGWGALLVLLSLLSSIAGTTYNYRMSTFGYKIRVSVTGLVYRCLLAVRTADLNSLGSGGLLNFLTSDADRIVNLAPSLHEMWAMPLQLALAVFLLYSQLGISSLVGVAFLCVLLPLNRLLAGQIGKFSKRLMLHKDVRIRLMSELLPNMVAVKLACWETVMLRRIEAARKQELRALRGQKLLDAGCVFFWAACPTLLAGSTFAVYAAIGNKLQASKVFTSLALFGMLIGPMNAFPWVINGVMEAVISMQRLTRLLSLQPGRFRPQLTSFPLKCSASRGHFCTDTIPTLMGSCQINIPSTAYYFSDPDRPALSNVSLKIQQGQLVGVLGPVGSGKSSLLLGILGELNASNGGNVNENEPNPRYAYVGQTPWLYAGSVQENITFGQSLDAAWLSQVVKACGLQPDLDSLPTGLDTNVGEGGGSRLSGGQRARIALARAVYQRADVYLLDDPLSALDVHVAEHVKRHCLLGLLSDRTRIICTHKGDWLTGKTSENCASTADIILELRNGQIVRNRGGIFNCPLLPQSNDQVSSSSHSVVGSAFTRTDADNLPLLTPSSANGMTEASGSNDLDAQLIRPVNVVGKTAEEGAEAEDCEQLAFGSIRSRVYFSYLRAVGYCLVMWILLSLTLMQGSRNAADWWLSKWVQDTGEHDNQSLHGSARLHYSPLTHSSYGNPYSTIQLFRTSWNGIYSDFNTTARSRDSLLLSSNTSTYYLKVYGILVAGNVVATSFRAVLFAFGGLAAAVKLHRQALSTVLRVCDTLAWVYAGLLEILCLPVGKRASVKFFEGTPQGRILNRFSADVGTIDDGLPFQLNILLANVAGLLGTLFLACLMLPMLFFLLLPLVFVFWSIQRTYRGAARDLKRIASVSRSPVYSHFTDTLSGGLPILRGLGQQERFRCKTATTLANQLRAELTCLAAGSWLSIRLQLIATMVVAGVTVASVIGRFLDLIQVTAIGLSVTYALNIASLMTNTVYDATETEKSLVAVERCQELVDDTPMEMNTVPTTVTAPVYRHRFLRRLSCPLLPPVLSTWPSEGCVEFRDVSLVYGRRSGNHQDRTGPRFKALKSVSFTVTSGERLGIVGRTGSGKSSLLRVLFRLVEHLPGPNTNETIAKNLNFFGASGQVLVDGVDIRSIPLSILRSRIFALSQETFLFSGCLRDNLDPENHLPDDKLHEVLIKCQLADNPSEAADWLLRNVGESGGSLSTGQRQLVCLARALLKDPRPRVLCFDESTAAIDEAAESAIHKVIQTEFLGATILLIAHRLSTVQRLCSRVLVMHKGRFHAIGDSSSVLESVSSDQDLIQLQ